jgi:hypothetical protein
VNELIGDLIAFAFGAATGTAILIPWVSDAYRRYVVNCQKAACPHHGSDNTKRMNDINDKQRNGPTRPDIK